MTKYLTHLFPVLKQIHSNCAALTYKNVKKIQILHSIQIIGHTIVIMHVDTYGIGICVYLKFLDQIV